jgi:hypothetical protein
MRGLLQRPGKFSDRWETCLPFLLQGSQDDALNI